MNLGRLLPLLLLANAAAGADERVENIFRVWDTDQNGVLTPAEVTDAGIFAQLDRDRDGKITRAEVAAHLGAKPEAAPPPREPAPVPAPKPKKPPRTISERTADFLRRFDANKDRRIQPGEWKAAPELFSDRDLNRDGVLSVRELRKYLRAVIEQAKKRPTPANFFELFDLDGDGRVTRREYDGPGAFFRRYDTNRDRVVTRAEMGLDMGMRNRAEAPDGPTREPQRGLLERFDEDGDGRITLEELGGAQSVLDRLDRNGDGVLSGAEVR